jgi:hypothetical protein
MKFGALLLGPAEHPDVFVRVLLGGPVPVLTPMRASCRSSGVSWPLRLAALELDGMGVEVTTATPPGLHRPVHLGLDALLLLCEEVARALSSGRRPEGVPRGWLPMHGDIAHWNLRRYPNGEVMLLDWESADWGPPHADLVRALMTAPKGRALGSAMPTPLRRETDEAARFWWSRLMASSTDAAPSWVRRAHAAQAGNLSLLMARS